MSFALRTILRCTTLIFLISSLVPLHGQADLLLGGIKEDFLSRRFSEAEAKLRQLLEKEPGDASAAYLMVRTLIEDNRPEEALVVAESAREQCSSCPLVHVAVGDAKYRKGEFEAASASYQEATQLDSREARALLGLGLILTSEFQFKAARGHLRKALELDPDDPDIADALASTLANGAEKIALQQRYAALATYRDPLELAAQGARLELLRSREAKPPLSLSRAPEEMVLPLVSVRNRAHAPPIAVLLPVSINGREPRNLLVDTGAHGLLISSRYAREDSVEPVVSYELKGLGDQGRLATKLGWADTIQIGDAVWNDCPVVITEKDPGPQWAGIIGTDVLQDFLVTLDIPKGEMRLQRLPARAPGEPPDDGDRGEIPGYQAVRQVGGKLLLQARVNDRRNAHFILDTGSIRSLMDRDTAESIMALSPSRTGVKGLSGRVEEVLQGRDVILEAGGIRHRESVMLVLDLSGLSHALGLDIGGLAGFSLLRDLCVSIDYRNGLIKLGKVGTDTN